MASNYYDSAYSFCLEEMKRTNDAQAAIAKTLNIFGQFVDDKNHLREFLYENISFTAEDLISVVCSEEIRKHDWWNIFNEKNKFSTPLWSRYKFYLSQNKNWSLKKIEKSINEPTDFVMNCISNPNLDSPQKRYGTVFGYVQSGKTANYIGLINKAFDAGYRIIIVLAGMHNNLRSQTQMRIDEEVLGFETSIAYLKGNENAAVKIGVGSIASRVQTIPEPVTSRDESGDYNKSRANLSRSLDNPKIYIVKKQKTVLENIYDNFVKNHAIVTNKLTGKKQFPCEYSLLLIDDEADQASVNTKYKTDKYGNLSDNSDVSKINELIRKILSLFQCKSYVGYTATPYANIFIPPETDHDDLGDDLFPKDFIISLPKPKGYIGALEFFGEDADSEIMPLRRKISTELEDFIDLKNKTIIGEIPKELKKAIMSFVIIIAVRNLRGQQTEPNSMLIHVNRLNNIQSSIRNLVEDYFDEFESYINGGDPEIIEELHDIWDDDFIPTTLKMKTDYSAYMKNIEDTEWCEVLKEIRRIIGSHQIKISEINGKSREALCYKEYRDENRQYNVIAVGGDKLSRGLTLEGLTVSFFMRSSMMYDTLMQMGRWFGFRPQYADLCRLYVSDYLFRCFMDVSYATENLREQIAYMNDCRKTPKDFGLRVSSHPDMLISSANKLKAGREQTYTFSNTVSQTRSIDVNADIYSQNFDAAEHLILQLGKPSDNHWQMLDRQSNSEHYFWDNVSGKSIEEFFREYRTSSKASKVNSLDIAEYIKDQLSLGGLTSWTVCLKNVGDSNGFNIGNLAVKSGLKRSKSQYVFDEKNGICSIKALKSKDEEYFDFTSEMIDKKDILKKNDKKDDYIRKVLRSRTKALLILCPLDIKEIEGLQIKETKCKTPFGFIVVFPDNNGIGNMKSYRLNSIAAESGDYIE